MSDKILELFDRPVDRRIEEVVKVDQTNVGVVREEIAEYVATPGIRKSFCRILEQFRETPNKPHEGIGIWISGFFGAGKSLFAKILGYVLENRQLDETSAAELFGRQTADPQLQALLNAIAEQIPAKAVIFDVSTDQTVTDASEKLTDVVYRVMLREFGYATDLEIGELEIELEGKGTLRDFEAVVQRVSGKDWNEVKHYPASARNVASLALHEFDSKTYPQADSWARTPRKINVTANFVAERAFELSRRRGGERALVFVVDEVGQYVARSTEKMLDLQGLVQALGKVGRNQASKWKGQVWLIVTSQERLSEVVDNLEGKQVELARLRDRFPIEVDLAPSDIREVTAERVLKKKPAARERLQRLFEEHSGKLSEATRVLGRLEGPGLSAGSFAELYPFVPYQIDLIIDIVSALRTQSGAARHVGGANRTIIKHAQQMLVNERTNLAEATVGRLATLDLSYDLLETLVNADRKRDVHEIKQHFGDDALETRVAKVLAVLQPVKSFVRSPENIAAVLHRHIEDQPVREEVGTALRELEKKHKVRQTEDGWELLSQAGKDWEEERRGIEVLPKNRSDLLRRMAEQLFREVRGYRHQNLKTFSVSPVINGQRLGRSSADIDLIIDFVTDPSALSSAKDRAREQSNTEEGKNALHWVVPILSELLDTVDELFRSGEMVRRYERVQTSAEQDRLLSEEKARESRHEARVAALLRRDFVGGVEYFRGVEEQISELGGELGEAVRGALAVAFDKLYPKFDLAAASVKGDEARRILTSDSLSGLPSVYYEPDDGLGLVIREAGDLRIDGSHAALTEILEFVRRRKDYGEETAGRALENEFKGFGYGWDLEVIMLLTATAFRNGQLEVYAGRRYTSYAEPGAHEVFRKTNAFRAATFTPPSEGGLGVVERAQCVRALEELYGIEVRPEEGAIAAALQERLPTEINRAHRVLSLLEANDLQGGEQVRTLIDELAGLTQGTARDIAQAFHPQRDEIQASLERLKQLEDSVAATNLEVLRKAQLAVRRLWPELHAIGLNAELRDAAESLKDSLESPEFFDHLAIIGQRAEAIARAYEEERAKHSEQLEELSQRLVDDLRNREIWEAVAQESRERLLAPFDAARAKARLEATSLTELQSTVQALESIHVNAAATLIALHEEKQRGEGEAVITRVKASRFASRGLHTEEDVEEALAALRQQCMAAIQKGEVVILE